MNALHKLYSIDCYKGKTKIFIDKCYKEYTLNDLIKELNNDKGYHMRIESDKNYIFFGDCDGFKGTFDTFGKMLVDFLANYGITVTFDDIQYTANEGVAGSY